jgi:CopG family transcriptional regulator, nickel-responsive regulator
LKTVEKDDKVARFTISLEQPLMDFIDTHSAAKGYTSRSEFIRDLVRQKIVEEKWEDGKEGFGVLTVIYDHHHRELSEKMIELQHTNSLNVVCNLHVHINHHDCLETILLKGAPSEIERIASEIGALKGVKHTTLARTSAV